MLLAVDEFHPCRQRDVASGELDWAIYIDLHRHDVVNITLHNDVFQVEDDLGDVFGDAVDGGELMQGLVELHRSYCCTRNGRKQHTTQRVADGVAEPWLEW